MGRHTKYIGKLGPISIRLPKSILDNIDQKSKIAKMSRTDMIILMLTHYVCNDVKYCKMMAKKACSEMYYWKNQAEIIEQEKEIDLINK